MLETYYVRPVGAHSNTQTGLSYANAWLGWANVSWGSGVSAVSGGDTLYVCGEHYFTTTQTIGAHGGTDVDTICIIRGDYPSDPGTVSFSAGGYFVNVNRNYTKFKNLSMIGNTSSIVYFDPGLTDITFDSCSFSLSNTNGSSCLSFAQSNAVTRNITISNCNFSLTTTGSSVISYFIYNTDEYSKLYNFVIKNNRFIGVNCNRSIIHLRTEDDVASNCFMQDVTITNNYFYQCKGTCIEVTNAKFDYNGLNVYIGGLSKGLYIADNTFIDCGISPSPAGGAIGIWGWSPGGNIGKVLIENNYASNVGGVSGGVNIFYTYGAMIRNNEFVDLYTSTIDGNALLFDHGNRNCVAHSNKFRNMIGKDGVFNSGVAVMILNSKDIKMYGNHIDGCRYGIHFGNKDASFGHANGQSSLVFNNTFLNCNIAGIYMMDTADKSNNKVYNNIFTSANVVSYSNTVVNYGSSWTGEENFNRFYGFANNYGHTLGTSSSNTILPATDTYGIPTPNGNLRGAGKFVGYYSDNRGVKFYNPPTIGAYEVTRTRRKKQPGI